MMNADDDDDDDGDDDACTADIYQLSLHAPATHPSFAQNLKHLASRQSNHK
jgi:hypothetical protein